MASITPADLYRGAAIALVFLLLIAIAETLRSRFGWGVEWTRKLVHLGGGLVCLSFPFLIQSHWVVLALAISMAALFLLTRRFGLLQSIHGIERKSRGSEYYPIVIYVLFLLAAGAPWKFVICVLVLAISDSAAAIVGTKYGSLRYRVEKDTKSVEGSLAFFVVTVVVVLIPLLLFRPRFGELHYPYLHYLLAATLIGLLVTCFEAVSGNGRDNLFVPLGTYLVLSKAINTDVSDLLSQNISFLAILIVLIGLSLQSRSFQTGGAIVICLASYACWALGSFDWALPIFIGYGFYVVAALTVELPWQLSIRPVVFNVAVPFFILVIANVAANNARVDVAQACFGPFLAAACVALSQATLNAVNWARRKTPNTKWFLGMLTGIACCFLLVIPSAFRLEMHDWMTLSAVLFLVVACSVASACLLVARPPVNAPFSWFAVRMNITAFAAVSLALLQLAGICQVWKVPV